MRRLTWLLFVLVSVVSMALGELPVTVWQQRHAVCSGGVASAGLKPLTASGPGHAMLQPCALTPDVMAHVTVVLMRANAHTHAHILAHNHTHAFTRMRKCACPRTCERTHCALPRTLTHTDLNPPKKPTTAGFYDLYKNVPHFKSLVIRAFMPASYLFEWLELHTQVSLAPKGQLAMVCWVIMFVRYMVST